jgi:hypothetical protein
MKHCNLKHAKQPAPHHAISANKNPQIVSEPNKVMAALKKQMLELIDL